MKVWNKNKESIENFSKEIKIKRGSIVQIAGSGGKTTLIDRLAEQNKGNKVGILTTTKRYCPKDDGIVIDEGESISLTDVTQTQIEFGTKTKDNKTTWIGEENFKKVKEWADIILIEADGSKNLPLKATSNFEPVFIKDSNITIVVCGLSAINKPLKEVCHRPKIATEILGVDDTHIITANDVAILLQKCYLDIFANLEPVFILNQADSEIYLNLGVEIANKLSARCYIAQFK